MSPGISSHRGPGTVPVEQPQQAVPPGLGGSEGLVPGYADFVTSAVGSAMEPFVQKWLRLLVSRRLRLPLSTIGLRGGALHGGREHLRG